MKIHDTIGCSFHHPKFEFGNLGGVRVSPQESPD
jgi:hypothetical protein